MTLILTNDDGIDAPGIKSLFKAVNGQDIIIAAPKDHQSGCGHGAIRCLENHGIQSVHI
jgi:5'-nucleotidase